MAGQPRFALTGSIACGKTTFVRFLKEAGVRVLDADDVVHELEAPGGAAVEAIAAQFGGAVRTADGGIDRKRLAQIVFCGDDAAAKRSRLENILFPLVRERLLAFDGVCVVPLLYECGWERDYDNVICLASSEEKQIERMVKTRGYTEEEAKARIAAQMLALVKMQRANISFLNDGSIEELRGHAWALAGHLVHTWHPLDGADFAERALTVAKDGSWSGAPLDWLGGAARSALVAYYINAIRLATSAEEREAINNRTRAIFSALLALPLGHDAADDIANWQGKVLRQIELMERKIQCGICDGRSNAGTF
ncbi:MAG: dephospho-CoA kinase [Kiritimatiellae bacterium]|nr:dephospho-CoA kinase [Kiritimatiellia bacterium]